MVAQSMETDLYKIRPLLRREQRVAKLFIATVYLDIPLSCRHGVAKGRRNWSRKTPLERWNNADAGCCQYRKTLTILVYPSALEVE